jgi:hypothetical protein
VCVYIYIYRERYIYIYTHTHTLTCIVPFFPPCLLLLHHPSLSSSKTLFRLYQGSAEGCVFVFQGGEGGRQAGEVLEACSVLGKARDDVVSKLNEARQMLKSGEVLLLRYSVYLLYWYKGTRADTGGGAA